VVMLLAAASAGWMAVAFMPGSDPTRVYYGSDTHSFGLLSGACLALLMRRKPSVGAPGAARRLLAASRPWLGGVAVTGLLSAAVWLPHDAAVTYRGGLAAVSVFSAVAIWAGVAGGRFGRMLDTAPLRYLGERSYGLYLWHWPVLVLLQLADPFGWGPDALVGTGLVALVLTLGVAAVSYRFLEAPVRRLGARAFLGALSARATALGIPARSRRRSVALLAVAAATSLALLGGTVAAVVFAPALTSAQAEVLRGKQAIARAEKAAAAEADRAAAAQAAGMATPESRGSSITAVGDSVMLASAAELQAEFPGLVIDAAVSRGMESAPAILAAQREAGALRDVVVVGLGTNGRIEEADLAAIMRVIGPNRELVMVNAFADRDWTQGVNDELADFSKHRNRVALADWHDAIAPHVDVLADDGIHPGPTGGAIYADSIASALERLTDAPASTGPGPDTLQAFRVR
jgi:hypothetical protein